MVQEIASHTTHNTWASSTDPQNEALLNTLDQNLNINHLVAALRIILSQLRDKKKVNEKADMKRQESEIRELINTSKSIMGMKAKISFIQGALVLVMAIAPAIPELNEMSNLFKGISDTTQLLGASIDRTHDASHGEATSLTQLLQTQLQQLESSMQSSAEKQRSTMSTLERMHEQLRI